MIQNLPVIPHVWLVMNPRLPIPPRLGRVIREYGLAVGIAIGAMVGLAFGNVAIGVVAGIPVGISLVS